MYITLLDLHLQPYQTIIVLSYLIRKRRLPSTPTWSSPTSCMPFLLWDQAQQGATRWLWSPGQCWEIHMKWVWRLFPGRMYQNLGLKSQRSKFTLQTGTSGGWQMKNKNTILKLFAEGASWQNLSMQSMPVTNPGAISRHNYFKS